MTAVDLDAEARKYRALRDAVKEIAERAERHGYDVDPDDLLAVVAAVGGGEQP